MIHILEKNRTFHLQTRQTSMVLHTLDSGHMVCLYWGSRIEDDSFSYIVKDIKRASYLSDTDGIKDFKLEQLPLLYPAYGNPDMRTPAFMFEYEDGSRITDLRYKGFNTGQSKSKIPGLPTLLTDKAECLELILADRLKKIEVRLVFGVFEEYDAVTQSVNITNNAAETLKISKIMSACFSFLDWQFDYITLTGAWGRECQVSRHPMQQGMFVLDSKRGASGHGQNPFLALAEPETGESLGNVYAMNFIYSGDFEIDVEVDMHQNTRLMLGLNSFDFCWQLASGDTFCAPEAVLVHSYKGFGEMSRIFHRLYRECLLPEKYREQIRPILINNWEATYFDFNKEKLLRLAKEASDLGMELFVLDDGWFGQRNSDAGSLGDWTVNEEKLGGTLAELAGQINRLGMKFGLWFEPEMVSPESELYKNHRDWVICVPGRKPQLARNQLVLDLCRTEVQDYVIGAVSNILDSAPIDYIKWDMNRNITDTGSSYLPVHRQKEVHHRYILGLYRILEVLTKKYPKVLFEGCAGGGGRFDAGMLCYTPQIWTSDDTDAVERLEIQHGTSMVYPGIAMGCHVSACPNHQVGRTTSIHTRGIVAMQGNLGYELNLPELSEEEKKEIREQVRLYKKIRHTVQKGRLYRLKHTLNEKAWMYISEDGKQIVVGYVQILARANTVPKRLKLAGLTAGVKYRLEGTDMVRDGSALMNIGLDLEKVKEDYYSRQWVLNREDL